MLALIQRVLEASVSINNEITTSITEGLLILCGFKATDNLDQCQKLLDKCFNYRIFADREDKMNLSLRDIQGEAIIVPQFTLVAETQKGLRPSFSKGMPPKLGQELFEALQPRALSLYPKLGFGTFGADMQVRLANNGPVTFLLEN